MKTIPTKIYIYKQLKYNFGNNIKSSSLFNVIIGTLIVYVHIWFWFYFRAVAFTDANQYNIGWMIAPLY